MIPLLSRFLNAVWRGPISRNFGAAVGAQLALLLSGTLSARLLGPQNRGYLAILAAWPSAIGQLGAVGIALACTYFLSAGLVGGPELISLLRSSALVQLILLTLINSAIVVGYTLISGAPILVAACLSLAQLPAALLADYGVALLLGARRHGALMAMRILGPATYAAGLTALYFSANRSINAVVALLVASVTLAGTITLFLGIRAVRGIKAKRSILSQFGRTEARKRILAFGRRGYVGYLSPVDTFRIDQLVVGFLVSPRALGIYVVGAAFTNFIRGLAFNIGLSSTSEIAAQLTATDRRRAVRRTLILAGTVLTLVTLALCVFVIFAIPLLFGSAYRSAILVAEILFVVSWILAMKRIAVDAMRGAGHPQIGTRPELVNLLVFLGACVPLGLTLGGPGVALALLIASAAGSLLLFQRLRKLGVVSASLRPEPELAPLSHDA